MLETEHTQTQNDAKWTCQTAQTHSKQMLRETTDRAWFSCLLRHSVRIGVGLFLQPWSPQGAWVLKPAWHTVISAVNHITPLSAISWCVFVLTISIYSHHSETSCKCEFQHITHTCTLISVTAIDTTGFSSSSLSSSSSLTSSLSARPTCVSSSSSLT